MKRTLRWFIAALALQPPFAAGGDVECRQGYRDALGACAQPSNLPDPVLRAGAQRACVDGARLTRSYCMSAMDAWLDGGEAAYERSVAACEATFDPAACGAGATCADTLLQQRANCIAVAVGVLASGASASPR